MDNKIDTVSYIHISLRHLKRRLSLVVGAILMGSLMW